MLEDKRNFIYFRDGSKMFHASGKFDSWCVYYEEPNKEPVALLDKGYFKVLNFLKEKYNGEKIYKDFVKIYDLVTTDFNQDVISTIQEISQTYGIHQLRAEKMFTVLYMAMVSEFHWVSRAGKPTVLNKRLKRLGVYQIVMLNYTPTDAANYSRHKSIPELREECERYGF